jgi:hypothetical protein
VPGVGRGLVAQKGEFPTQADRDIRSARVAKGLHPGRQAIPKARLLDSRDWRRAGQFVQHVCRQVVVHLSRLVVEADRQRRSVAHLDEERADFLVRQREVGEWCEKQPGRTSGVRVPGERDDLTSRWRAHCHVDGSPPRPDRLHRRLGDRLPLGAAKGDARTRGREHAHPVHASGGGGCCQPCDPPKMRVAIDGERSDRIGDQTAEGLAHDAPWRKVTLEL